MLSFPIRSAIALAARARTTTQLSSANAAAPDEHAGFGRNMYAYPHMAPAVRAVIG